MGLPGATLKATQSKLLTTEMVGSGAIGAAEAKAITFTFTPVVAMRVRAVWAFGHVFTAAGVSREPRFVRFRMVLSSQSSTLTPLETFVTVDGVSPVANPSFFFDQGWRKTQCDLYLQANVLVSCSVTLYDTFAGTDVTDAYFGLEWDRLSF